LTEMALFKISTSSTLNSNDFSAANNNDGTIKHGGNIASSRFTNLNIGKTSHQNLAYVPGSGDDVNPINATAFAAGRFADMAAGEYVMRRTADELAGQSNTKLASGGSDFGQRKSPPGKVETIKTVATAKAIREGKWNPVTGTFDAGAPETNTSGGWSMKGNVAATGDTDGAANDSIAQPGELVYRTGAPTPKVDHYKPRTNG
jgi:hypothetical protein